MKLKIVLSMLAASLLLLNCSGTDSASDSSYNNNNSSNNSNSGNNGSDNNSDGEQTGDNQEPTSNPKAYPTAIKQTGQIKSYDINGIAVTDGSIKDDGYYQAGTPREFVKNIDLIEDISDNLIWEYTQHSNSVELSYSDAVSYCSSLNIDSLDSWRLPNIKELLELVSYSTRSPALDSEFSDVKSGDDSVGYWSSSATGGGFSLWISFSTGNDHFFSTQSNKHYTMCVEDSSSSWQSANFTRKDSGVVVDNNSKLWWQDNQVVESKDWKEAIDYCESLNLDGYSDWRVPNINELASIIDYTKSGTRLDDIFKNSSDIVYWSSTSHIASSKISWDINFKYGTNSYHDKKDKQAVRCVRGGEVVNNIEPTSF